MSIRIYALSKEFNVDSKEILDAIRQLGIKDKGSSLATLTDEEVDIVQKHLHAKGYSKRPNRTVSRPFVPAYERTVNLDAPVNQTPSQSTTMTPVRTTSHPLAEYLTTKEPRVPRFPQYLAIVGSLTIVGGHRNIFPLLRITVQFRRPSPSLQSTFPTRDRFL